nr:DNA translocase FtsK [Methylobacterium platani]
MPPPPAEPARAYRQEARRPIEPRHPVEAVPPTEPGHPVESMRAAEPVLPAEAEAFAVAIVEVAPEIPAPRRASHWAPDPALVPDGGWTMPIPPAGPARAVLTRARRREAEPDHAVPEVRARPAPAERPAEAGVRFTRTPDHVLQARQRRREQALREKEEARLAAEAEAAARIAAELAAAEAALAEAEAAAAAASVPPVPLWRQPYVLPPGVRFTRTPDHLLRHPQEETSPAEAAAPDAGPVETVPSEAAEPAPEAGMPVVPAETPAAEAVAMPDLVLEAVAASPEIAEEPAQLAETAAPEAAGEPFALAPDAVVVETVPPAPDLSAADTPVAPAQVFPAQVFPAQVFPAQVFPAQVFPAQVFPAQVFPTQVFDVPNSAILVPVDVSHLRSLPARPVYTLDRLLQHDWTLPLPNAAEQDNRPLPEPVAEEPTAEAPSDGIPAADVPAVAAAEAPSPGEEPGPTEPAAAPAPAAEAVADGSVAVQAVAAPEPVAEAPIAVAAETIAPVIPSPPAAPDTAPAAEQTAEHTLAAALLPATILLPAPAPMLALTYAPCPAPSPDAAGASHEVAIVPVPAASEPPAAPRAIEEAPAGEPEPAVAAPLVFAPVPWSFIATDTLPVAAAEESAAQTLPAVTTLAPAAAEDLTAAEPAAQPASHAAQPFVYVPTGRLSAQLPAPTLPSPPRPPRIILPMAAPSVPLATQPGPAAEQAVPVAVQPDAPAPEADTVAAASWSPSPAPEPHGLVIGTTGLVTDLGLDADDDGEDDDILAPVATIPLRPAARFVDVPYELPSVDLLAEPRESDGSNLDPEMLEDNALQLQQVIQDFGVRGEILAVRPGPVVTLYEMEPAPGTKSSRVISLADDIARSMSAISARVAVVQGRNAIGIELPNLKRETVYLRELLTSPVFTETKQKLALCLGKNIGGEAIIADLARMPHLLVAGTTGSGKSVAINTMILSLLYRMKPEECRLIMVDPKMLELSVYDGIPHLLSPVVTDPKKAVIALKWAVREMEERYKKMARLGVRNIDGFNARVAEARARGEVITRTVQTGFDRETGEAIYEDEVMDLTALPYIVIVVDEMADLMMVAGKDIEGAIQRLAQMARAAGLHLIMATQRPSVDVITGTIKANFPTRISFQVTSKIDSRTILGEMGAEQLLGQGDMLFMAGGGRTTRVHGPFCSDDEVEQVVAHLKRQGRPSYLDAVTADEEAEEAAAAAAQDAPVMDQGSFGDPTADLYDQAVAVVLRDKKASTSYIQRRLQIGYNRAASLMERMEREGIVGPANHAGKREILIEPAPQPGGEEA